MKKKLLWLKHAFAVKDGSDQLTDQDVKLINQLAELIVRKGLTTPSILFLEMFAPLNFIGSSILTFFRPTLGIVFQKFEYDRLENLLAKRCSVGLLTSSIEKLEKELAKRKAETCLKSMSS